MPNISVELRAAETGAAPRRAWRAHVGADLFGRWYAQVTFGRIGSAGRTMRWEFSDEAEAMRFFKHCLQRRAGAIRRIGVAYRAVEACPDAFPLLTAAGLTMACEKECLGDESSCLTHNSLGQGVEIPNG